MQRYLLQFFSTIAAATHTSPQEVAKFFYIAVIILILVLLMIAIFRKMKAIIWVVIGFAIMTFAFGGVGKEIGEMISAQIDTEYCQAHPETFWCE